MAIDNPASVAHIQIQEHVEIWSQGRQMWYMFRRHKAAMISAAVLIIMVLAVYLAPLVAPYQFDAIDLKNIKAAPTLKHMMGTDDLGRDLFTRVLYGGRVSMTIGIVAALVGTLFGSLVGALAGFYGGRIDNILMRFTDIAFSIPSLPLLIVLSSYTDSALPVIILIIGLLSWMPSARVVRGSVLSIKELEYVNAARLVGASDARIIFSHILPNTLGPIIVGATLGVGASIITESSLSFLGLGVTPPTPTWGNMLQDSQQTMVTQPWLTIFPGLAILLTVLSINFIGDGLNDAMDPTLRQ